MIQTFEIQLWPMTKAGISFMICKSIHRHRNSKKWGSKNYYSFLSSIQKDSNTVNTFRLTKQSVPSFIWVSWNDLWAVSVAWGRNIVNRLIQGLIPLTLFNSMSQNIKLYRYWASPDFFLFPKIKLEMKGRFFQDVNTIWAMVTTYLTEIPIYEYLHIQLTITVSAYSRLYNSWVELYWSSV